VIQKAARKGEDGNPDGSQIDLDDVIIVWKSLVKLMSPGKEKRVHSLHRDHRQPFQLMWGGQQTFEGANGRRVIRSLLCDLRDELRQNSPIHHLIVRECLEGRRHDEVEVDFANKPMTTIPM
jgi:hypothetical protein